MALKKIAVIGAGISGLSIAQCLRTRYEVTVFERESAPGGLIRCERVNGHLYHLVGGHVFNSKNQAVLDWFWHFFNKEKEFTKAIRNASIAMEGVMVDYPIENNVYQLPDALMRQCINDFLAMAGIGNPIPENFGDFLLQRFGKTLYSIYFQPYNEKIWRCDLKKVPLSWLEGKLPMPTVPEILYNNFNHVKECDMVHSSFFYAKNGGSQFIADRLSEGLQISCKKDICHIGREKNAWLIDGVEFDNVIFCGNVKDLPQICPEMEVLKRESDAIQGLEYHGTTSVLCELNPNPYSWIYMPDRAHLSHRIICTGNFSKSNNSDGKMTATIEFTDEMPENEILDNLSKIPFSPKYVAHRYTKYTYPVQNEETRALIGRLKLEMESQNVFLLGRFAEWEYYNMDAAMAAAINLSKRIE